MTRAPVLAIVLTVIVINWTISFMFVPVDVFNRWISNFGHPTYASTVLSLWQKSFCLGQSKQCNLNKKQLNFIYVFCFLPLVQHSTPLRCLSLRRSALNNYIFVNIHLKRVFLSISMCFDCVVMLSAVLQAAKRITEHASLLQIIMQIDFIYYFNWMHVAHAYCF